MPKFRVVFKDGTSMVVEVAADAETSRDSLKMIAKKRAIQRKYHPGTLPDQIAAGGKVERVEPQ